MAPNIFLYILIIFNYLEYISCVDYQYDKPNLKPNNPENQGVSVHFPKYNIKIAPTIVKRPSQIVYQDAEIPKNFEDYHLNREEIIPDYNQEYHEPTIYYVESEPIRVFDYNTEHSQPIAHYELQNNYNNEHRQPIIHHQELESNYDNAHRQPVIYNQELENNYNNENKQPNIHYQEVHSNLPFNAYNNDFNQGLYVHEQYQPTYYTHKEYNNGHVPVHLTPQIPFYMNHYEHSSQPESHLYTHINQNTQVVHSPAPHQQYQPIITRDPVEIPHKINPEYLRNSENFDEDVGLSRKHKNNWFYNPPNWNENSADMNILRTSDPRALVTSHTSFLKIKKPVFGSKVIFTHHKKYIDTPHLGFGGTNIHKKTHIQVYNRDANENDNNQEIIGSHFFASPRWRRESTDIHSRQKRAVLDIAKLIIDPKSKLDIEKTSENVGAATRNAFEGEYSPMFHLANALGSAQDSFRSFMNVRPSGILVPCSYRIVNANDAVASPIVGDINPAIYNRQQSYTTENSASIVSPIPDDSNPSVPDGYNPSAPDESQYMSYDNGDPFHLIGHKLRESVQWAQKSAQHAVDAMHHVRNVFVTARRNWPKMILPYAGAIQVNRPQSGEEIVSTDRDPEYVGIGKLMDSLGMTDRKPDPNVVGGPRMISEEEMILKKAKEVLGAPTYKHFLDDMKKHLDISSSSEQVGRSRLTPNTDLQTKLALNKLRTAIAIQRAKSNLIKLQAPKVPKLSIPKIPQLSKMPNLPYIKSLNSLPRLANPLVPNSIPQIPHPFIPKPIVPPKHPSLIPINPLLKSSNPTPNISNPALEKINSVIESLKPTTTPLEKLRTKLYQKFNITKDGNDLLGKTLNAVKNEDPETVGTAQNGEVPVPVLTKEMRTPFMGLATKQDLENYFKKLYCNNCKMGNIK